MQKSEAPYAPQATRSAFGEAGIFEVLADPLRRKRRFPPGAEPFRSWRLSSASRYRLRRLHARLVQKTTPPPITRLPPYRRSEGKLTRRRNKRGSPQQAPRASAPPNPGLCSFMVNPSQLEEAPKNPPAQPFEEGQPLGGFARKEPRRHRHSGGLPSVSGPNGPE